MAYSGTSTPGTISVSCVKWHHAGKSWTVRRHGWERRRYLRRENGKHLFECGGIFPFNLSPRHARLTLSLALVAPTSTSSSSQLLTCATAVSRAMGDFSQAQGPWESKRSGIGCVCFRHLQRLRVCLSFTPFKNKPRVSNPGPEENRSHFLRARRMTSDHHRLPFTRG
ncbi:hypothetical protein CCHR01_18631 [Colletotrichum chrysophilum]|uniref:Uncharacterized protein n=1 Tax=Colletotrichum chrysophilum TaxID=1836956 RepID=A0AAD9A1A6_9PEZI|nr:hypothetical protein CCHR01_18631 [Colletotrichum chrysophilum]